MDINHFVRIMILAVCAPWFAKGDPLNVDTKRPYYVIVEDIRPCVAFENAEYTTITNASMNPSEIRLVSALAEIYARRIALKEQAKPVIQTDSFGRRLMRGVDHLHQFPPLLSYDFMVYGTPYNRLEMTIVPYEIRNRKMSGFLKGALCEYRLEGEFRFGLYVCLNTYKVSSDFLQASPSPATVSRLGCFPYLHDNMKEQRQFALYVNKLGLSSECNDSQERKTGVIHNDSKNDVLIEVEI